MSNSNDPKTGFSRFASSANADKNAQEGNSTRSPFTSNQSGLSNFASRPQDPLASRFTARMQQANVEPESAASIFSRKMAALEEQKKVEAARQVAEANYVNPAQTLLDKITKPSLTVPKNTTATTTKPVGNAQLSFKERMEALNKKQEEIRLAASSIKATSQNTQGQGLTKPASTLTSQSSRPAFASAPRSFATRPMMGQQATDNTFGMGQSVGQSSGTSSVAPSSMQTPSTAFMERKPLFTATRKAGESPLTTRSNPIVPTQAKGDFKISTEEFIELRDFLYEQAGIFVAENRKYLMENRLSSRLRELGLRNFHEYHKYLKFDNNRKVELNKLFENMTTNETSFFRNNPQLDVFRDKVLARVINEQRAKGQKKIHIWSAGCSSGEEPYTISMIAHELLKNEIDSWDIKITANDLSLAMLATARNALYSEYALRTTPQEMIDKYFTKEGKMFRVLPKVQKLVNFSQINLASAEQLAKVERSQIVFCRNVIIYFDDEMKRHVISSFYDNLLPGGFLLIGHSESLHSISRAFVPEHFTGAIVYGKKS